MWYEQALLQLAAESDHIDSPQLTRVCMQVSHWVRLLAFACVSLQVVVLTLMLPLCRLGQASSYPQGECAAAIMQAAYGHTLLTGLCVLCRTYAW